METIKVLSMLARNNNIAKMCFCRIDFSKDDSYPEDEVDLLFFHRKNTDFVFINTESIEEVMLCDLAKDGYVLNSQVYLKNGSLAHLPLLDFNIEPGADGVALAIRAIKMLGKKNGYLLNSGSSYHYIGCEPMTVEEHRAFLHHALLLAPIVDGRWVAHQLINGSSNLRMGEKNGKIPYVVSKIEK